MTKDQVIMAIETIVEPLDMDLCTRIAEALVTLKVVTDDGDNFHPTAELNNYPDDVHKFVAGMCLINVETRQ